jgi:hypothetical protein
MKVNCIGTCTLRCAAGSPDRDYNAQTTVLATSEAAVEADHRGVEGYFEEFEEKRDPTIARRSARKLKS